MALPWLIGYFAISGVLISTLGSYFIDAGRWVSSQVALDNLAIRSGETDRAILNFLVETNRKLKALELRHHHYHGCALSPVPTISQGCEVLDAETELEIALLVDSSWTEAESKWAGGAARIGTTLQEIGRGGASTRPPTLPVFPKKCVCGVDAEFVLNDSSIGYWFQALEMSRLLDVGVNLRGGSLKPTVNWNYELVLGEGNRR